MNNLGARRWWALGAVTLAVVAVGLDATVLSVALPTLATSLHASESDLQWFSSGYLLVLAAAMLPAGLLGDRFGRKWVLLGALALFGAASAGCAYSQTVGEFIAARVVLGVAGAGIVVMALSAVTVLFSETERPRACRGVGGGELRLPPPRTDPGRLAAEQLLVGLDLPAQRAGRADRARRGPRPGPPVSRPRTGPGSILSGSSPRPAASSG